MQVEIKHKIIRNIFSRLLQASIKIALFFTVHKQSVILIITFHIIGGFRAS